ncbi:MAG: hypothetical protein OXU75_06435 [Deltaproteobacteria bacterium]|nr:hypothetical protein [Deltaproteobacteria bacterium]
MAFQPQSSVGSMIARELTGDRTVCQALAFAASKYGDDRIGVDMNVFAHALGCPPAWPSVNPGTDARVERLRTDADQSDWNDIQALRSIQQAAKGDETVDMGPKKPEGGPPMPDEGTGGITPFDDGGGGDGTGLQYQLDAEVCDFAKNVSSMRDTASGKKDWKAIALAVGAGFFVYSKVGTDGPWMTPKCRCVKIPFLGKKCTDAGAADSDYTGQVSERQSLDGTGGTGGTGTKKPGGGGGGGGIAELLGPGVAPTIVERRTCPPMDGERMRLAKNGQCYPKRLLPESMYMSPEEKSPVTAADKKRIAKARATQRRIRNLAEKMDLLPDHHRTTHHVVHHRKRR